MLRYPKSISNSSDFAQLSFHIRHQVIFCIKIEVSIGEGLMPEYYLTKRRRTALMRGGVRGQNGSFSVTYFLNDPLHSS